MKNLVKFTCLFLLSLCGCSSVQKNSQVISVKSDALFVSQLLDDAAAGDESLLISPAADRSTYLLSKNGQIIHKWSTGLNGVHTKLGQDGLLYGLYRNPKMRQRSVTGLMAVHSRSGDMLWSYEDPLIHHSLEPLSSGNVLLFRYAEIPKNQRHGVIKESKYTPVCDEIIEVNPQGKISWSLPISDLVQIGRLYKGTADSDPIARTFNMSEYCHGNSLRYYEKTPFSDKPAILASFRDINQVLLIEKESKKLLWSSDDIPLISQHDARLYGDDILVFNNNSDVHRPSEVLLINMKSRNVTKLFGQKEFMHQEWSSSTMSGAQYLSNGNLLITISQYSQVWELTPEGKIVFKLHLISPNFLFELGSGLYTAEAYSPSFLEKFNFLPKK